MNIRSFLAVAVVAALPGLALAQDAPKPEAKTETTPPAATKAEAGAGGMMMADTATAEVSFLTLQPADALTSKLVGLSVVNANNETVGDIEDFVIVDGKTIHAVILGVGGFLGIGERYVAVSPSSITLSKKDDNLRALINTNKDELTKAPAYEYSKKKS